MQEAIEVGFQTFVSDGGEEFGAVREVRPNGRPELVIYVENAGDFCRAGLCGRVSPFAEGHLELREVGPSPATSDRPRTRRRRARCLTGIGPGCITLRNKKT
jgi:hypothetical protein